MRLMAMVAGAANIGRVPATDLISAKTFPTVVGETAEEQDARIRTLVTELAAQKTAYWQSSQVPPEQWQGPTLLLAVPSAAESAPRLWRADMNGATETVEEILQTPGIRLEGAYASAFTLLYGYEGSVLAGLAGALNIEMSAVSTALQGLPVLKPIDRLNLWTMPTQDAVELAVFLAEVQEQMDRFLPGTPLCGGPIDVMILQMAPEPGIVSFPGKVLHHPRRHLGGTE
jgi:hypothetical protein